MTDKKLTRREFVQLTGIAAIGVAAGCDRNVNPSLDSSAEADAIGTADLDLTPGVDQLPPLDLDASGSADLADLQGSDADATTENDIADLTAIGPDPLAIAINTDKFPMGVQAGEVLVDAAILWTRYLGSDPLRVWLFRDTEGTLSLVDELSVTPADEGYCHLDVLTLEAATQYVYTFFAGDSIGKPLYRSALGRFRTPPAADALVPVRFGGTSCVSQPYKPYRPLGEAAKADLDFFILSGDTVYNDGSVSLSQYRTSWRNGLNATGYRDLFASTSIVATWDDHEITNNFDPESVGQERIDAANQAFFEHLALRRDSVEPNRKWKRFRWGRAVEVFVLDCRGERLPSTRGTANAVYLSAAQMSWLKTGLSESDAIFKFIVNSVPITDMPSFYPSENDRWEGYVNQREEILNHVAGISGVVWLSGDFHFGASARIEKSGLRNGMIEYFMGPGGQLPNPAWLLLNTQNQKAQFPFVTGKTNTMRFSVDPLHQPPLCIVEVIDGDGEVLHTEQLTA